MPVRPVPAATVMLVRDGIRGPEVFLVERHGAAAAFGGLHVFPGGKLDPADRGASLEACCRGPDDAHASRILGVPRGGLAYWVACIRECFEEAGVLLATHRDGAPLALREPEVRRRFADWRARLNRGEPGALRAMCEAEALVLAADRLAYVSHWITPLDQVRRFDTRFFVARAPHHQEALHDGAEVVHSLWLRPEEALERFREGRLRLISPTRSNLEGLCGHASADALLAARSAVDPRHIPAIRPRMSRRDGGVEETLEVWDGREPR